MNYTIAIVVLVILSACAQDYSLTQGRHAFWTPEPLFMANLPDGDDSYSQGFRDGCNTAIGSTGSAMLRSAHDIAFDVNRGIEDRDYYRGYRIGNNYCTYYVDSDPL